MPSQRRSKFSIATRTTFPSRCSIGRTQRASARCLPELQVWRRPQVRRSRSASTRKAIPRAWTCVRKKSKLSRTWKDSSRRFQRDRGPFRRPRPSSCPSLKDLRTKPQAFMIAEWQLSPVRRRLPRLLTLVAVYRDRSLELARLRSRTPPRGGSGGDRSREDHLLLQCQPRIPDSADLASRAARRRAGEPARHPTDGRRRQPRGVASQCGTAPETGQCSA